MWSNLDLAAGPWPLIHGYLLDKWLPTPMNDPHVLPILSRFISACACFRWALISTVAWSQEKTIGEG